MANDPQIVAVLADSRGLDTYYLNPQYPAGYGIDRVFATRLSRILQRADTSPAYDAVLLPEHFRAGSLENRVLRLALTDPVAVILCDGIWETLLNREKHFRRAEELGRLPAGLYGSDTEQDREHAGAVLTEMFMGGELEVSPAAYSASLAPVVGYFARRRRRVYWLSLPPPPPDHRGGIHYAGNYRPLPGWDRRLQAINDAAAETLCAWGQGIVRLEPLIEEIGGAENALLDLWHFTPDFHDHVARHLADRLVRDLAAAPLPDRHPSRDALVPGRVKGWPVLTLGRDIGPDRIGGLRDTILVIPEPDATSRDGLAQEVLSACHTSVITLFPEEV